MTHKNDSKRLVVDKGTVTDPTKKVPNIAQTLEKGTNIEPIELQETSKVEESSIKQNSQENRMPYRHPNHN
jgi:hypothetical protein